MSRPICRACVLSCLIVITAVVAVSAAPITTDLELWLDAADSSTLEDAGGLNPGDGGFAGDVNLWRDKSGFSRDATAVAAGQRPAFTAGGANGNGALNFVKASTDAMRGALPAGMSVGDITFFTVSNAATIGGRRTIFDTADPVNRFGIPQMQDLDGAQVGFHNGGVADPPRISNGVAGSMLNNWFISSLTRSGGAALGNGSSVTIKHDGTAFASTTANQTWNSNSSTGFGVGEQVGFGNTFDGPITEALAFDRALNAAERKIVENYLSSKYNTGLAAADDKYSGDTPGNGDYDRDVFGIGRDLAQGSSPAGAVTTGTGGGPGASAGLTLSELNGSLANGEYALAGHRVVTNAITNGQWDRVWNIDVTGDVDATLTFDFSDAGLAGQESGNFGLFFSSTDESGLSFLTGGSLAGDQFSFNLSSLQDGLYTLGQVPLAPEPGTLALMTIALASMAAWYWRRRGRPGI